MNEQESVFRALDEIAQEAIPIDKATNIFE